MRVVSQRKDASYDFDRTVFWTRDEAIYATVQGKYDIIAKYDTAERTKEVFLDMHKAFSPVQLISTNMDEQQISTMFAVSEGAPLRCVAMNDPEMEITAFDNTIYYMPEK